MAKPNVLVSFRLLQLNPRKYYNNVLARKSEKPIRVDLAASLSLPLRLLVPPGHGDPDQPDLDVLEDGDGLGVGQALYAQPVHVEDLVA